jgi:hypothetical protein
MERSAGVNDKGKEHATNTSGSSDAHTPLTAPYQLDSNEQPNTTHMMLFRTSDQGDEAKCSFPLLLSAYIILYSFS